MVDFHKNRMEFLFLALLVIGMLIALASPNAAVSYAIIFLSGFFAGKFIYGKKSKIKFPYFMIIMGFFIGYIIGVYYASRRIAIMFFIVGYILSYKLYEKRILK